MTTEATFQLIPLIDLVPSPRNHRKYFDEKKMAELTDSIKEKGVLQPILVRDIGTGYELVVGERRYRASKAAGLASIPAVVRELTDEQVLECQAIENGQREDVHPLEEAAGYHDLMKLGKRDAEWIAGRIGKSVKYVYDRIKLLALTKEAQQLFWDGEIEAGHAILLARLTPAQQKQVIEDDRYGLFDDMNLSFTPEEEEALDQKTQERLSRKARTVRELQDYINDHFRFDPAQADTFLFPDTTSTVQKAAEKKEKVVCITHDLHIQDKARDPKQRTIVPSSWERADGKHGSKPCEHSVIGVVVCGPGRGDSFRVCLAKEKCKTHWGQWQKERARRGTSPDMSLEQREAAKAEQEAEREREALKSKIIHETDARLAERLAAKVPTPPKGKDLEDLVFFAMTRAEDDINYDDMARLGFKGGGYQGLNAIKNRVKALKPADLWPFLMKTMLLSFSGIYSEGSDRVAAAAARHGVNRKDIEKAVRAEMETKKPKAEKQEHAKANGKKKKAA